FVALGKDPMRGLEVFFVQQINGLRPIIEVLLKATPLVLCALGLAVCYRANVWNIGAEGQLLVGAIAAGGVALWLSGALPGMPRGSLAVALLVAGVLGGMAWAALTAWLRDRCNANE
ncbi:MAG: ABC transporter permease subunit, partial [bacterium]